MTGLFGLFRRTPPSAAINTVPPRAALKGGTGKLGLEVVGESHYQPALKQARKRARRTVDGLVVDAIVRPEPTNQYDADALSVICADGGALLGYLSRDRAQQYKRVFADCEAAALDVMCIGVLRGGEGDAPSIGIWLDLAFPAQLKLLLKAHKDGQAG